MSPLISVILPVYNAESYLKEAIDSILNQTITDFELLIYNDGSKDDSIGIIQSYTDPRIIVKDYHENKGLIYILNKGLSESKGKYIARMDADDISLPTRFDEQVKFLDAHPDHGICGTQVKLIGTEGMLTKPCDDQSLRWWIFKGSPLAHPSVMMRTSMLRDNGLTFKKDAYVVEDFDLWWRMAFHTKLANLDKVLLYYRVHGTQESSAKNEIQTDNFRANQIEFMKTLDIDTQLFSPEFVNDLLSRKLEANPINFELLWRFFEELKQSAQAVKFFGQSGIQDQFDAQAVFMLSNMSRFDLRSIRLFSHSGFTSVLRKAGISKTSFALKSILQWKTR